MSLVRLKALLVFRIDEGSWPFCKVCGRKSCIQAVVIPCRDGVEFVIVTFDAPQGHPEKDLPCGVDDIVQIDLACLGFLHHGIVPWPHAEEITGNQPLSLLGRIIPRKFRSMELGGVLSQATRQGLVGQFVSCQLFDQELVIRFVLIECPDNVIAIAPGVGAFVVIGHAAGIGISNHIQPVLSPALSIMRACQKVFDQPFDDLPWAGCQFPALHPMPQLFGLREKACQIEKHATNQLARLGGWSRGQAICLALLLQKGIDRMMTLVPDLSGNPQSLVG